MHGIEECVRTAQNGGVGVIVYFRKEGRSLGEVGLEDSLGGGTDLALEGYQVFGLQCQEEARGWRSCRLVAVCCRDSTNVCFLQKRTFIALLVLREWKICDSKNSCQMPSIGTAHFLTTHFQC